VARYAGRAALSPTATIDELGLSSLDRVDLMVALEDAYQTRLDEQAFSAVQNVAQLRDVVEDARRRAAQPAEAFEFPAWNRSFMARAIRSIGVPSLILPLTRLFAWIRVNGREHLTEIKGPVIFASNHQSFMDTPVIMAALPARWRYRLAPAMAKDFFDAHFFPREHGWRQRIPIGTAYYLAALVFNAFPLPQREAGTRQTLRYMGELIESRFSILIFPEGRHTETGEIGRFLPGVGMIASRLDVPVVPVRLEGLDRVLHSGWHMARPGHVRVTFGAPIHVRGTDYESCAKAIEDAVRALGSPSQKAAA
jgi:long-chain acyl-CoA synthetase